jgi:hypothetical protein
MDEAAGDSVFGAPGGSEPRDELFSGKGADCDYFCVFDKQGPTVLLSAIYPNFARGHFFSMVFTTSSKSAMRTATPFVTCSTMTELDPSARLDSISMPRFIGPGCMTIAAGAASFIRS